MEEEITMSNITFGICTYNRKELLIQSAQSLSLIDHIDFINIRIYDDCSTEYDAAFLREIFPNAKSIFVSKKNQGADKNTSFMYEDFLKTEDEWLFNADSDLIYNIDIVDKILYFKEKCDGFMTFLNSIMHKTISEYEDFVGKDSVGAAGCLLRRDIVCLILDNIKYREWFFDVNFSKLLLDKGHILYASKNSFVQHIGVSGFNSRILQFDYGENFQCDSNKNAEIIERTFENYVKVVRNFRNSFSWKCCYFIISIPRRLKKLIKRLTVVIRT